MMLDEIMAVKVPGNLQSTLQMEVTMIMSAIIIITIIIYITIITTKERGGLDEGEGGTPGTGQTWARARRTSQVPLSWTRSPTPAPHPEGSLGLGWGYRSSRLRQAGQGSGSAARSGLGDQKGLLGVPVESFLCNQCAPSGPH